MSKKALAGDRAWELDFLRGTALIMRCFMHMSWDIRYEFRVDVSSYLVKGWFWSFVHPVIVVLFVSVSGICCTFSRSNIKRGLKLLGATLVLFIGTFVATYFFNLKTVKSMLHSSLQDLRHLLSQSFVQQTMPT